MRHIRVDGASRTGSVATAAATDVFKVFIIDATPPVFTASAVWQPYASNSELTRPKTGANVRIPRSRNYQTRRDFNPLTAAIPGDSRAKSA
jgi:hypothetical protein